VCGSRFVDGGRKTCLCTSLRPLAAGFTLQD
jgi:hypothetical protein